MIGIKRQQNFAEFDDLQIKQSRIKLEKDDSSKMYLENLSNELFYEIFDYLNSCDIYKAFSNLNIRFQNLIFYSPFSLKINFCTQTKSIIADYCRYLIIPNTHRIISFNLRSESVIDQFFKYCTIDSSFNRLESIILHGLTDRQLLTVLFYLNSLPRLFSLTIDMEDDYYYNLGDTYRLIFSLSKLKYNKMSLFGYEELLIEMPIILNERFSTIEYLIIDYSCTLDQLDTLLRHTPRLCHLRCERLVEPDDNIKQYHSITMSHLIYISIGECQIEFDDFERFFKEISFQLEVLYISISWNMSYLDANRWEHIIQKYMPHLKNFHFTYDQYIGDILNTNPNHEFINGFISSFWLERKWFCELKIDRGEMVFLIEPHKKEWSKFYEFTADATYSKHKYIQNNNIITQKKTNNCSIQMTIEDYMLTEQYRSNINKLKPTFSAIRFTHLNINNNNISISMLIEILRLLPNLESLKLSSLSIIQSTTLSVEDTKQYLLVSVMNQITKVKLNKVTEKIQIQFLINLCPRMQYLEVDCMSYTDLEMFMTFILINQITHIPDLYCLCLNVPNANDHMIKTIALTIELETIIDNYKIQRIGNKFFFHWKLMQ
ncbi:unnamed protein product [Rotaria sp. Silwood1]|nr:unnamed protein product [Rotaria sp. Silwood1]